MGLFCASIIVKGPDAEEILPYLRQRGRIAWVSSTEDGITLVCDDEFGGQDVISRRFSGRHLPHLYSRGETAWEPLVRDLSTRLACVVFAMEVYDGDYFYYELHEAGRLVDEYVSDPDPFGSADYFGGEPVPDNELLSRPIAEHAAILCRAFGNEAATLEVTRILTDSGTESATYRASAIEQFRAVIKALDLPEVTGIGKAAAVVPANAPYYPDFTATRWA